MTERYYKKEYNNEYYIFDNNTITEEKFEEKYETEGYRAFEDSLTSDEIIKRLNTVTQENQHIKHTIQWLLENTKTSMGKSILKQLQELIQ